MRRAELALNKHALRAAVAAGRLIRVRRGWYAEPGTDPLLLRAVAVGGHLACVSALEARGIWTLPHALHVAVPAGVTTPAGVVRHIGPQTTAVESAEQAFRRFVRCGAALEIVVAADSAIQRGVLGAEFVSRTLCSSRRNRRLLSRIDGTAESGLETIARVRLRARGVNVRTQVPIGGYRVDLLIGERLIVELDGRRWHDTESSFEWDRRRDAELVSAGYLVLRFSFRRVMEDWPTVEAQILSLIRRREHVRRPNSIVGGRSSRPGA